MEVQGDRAGLRRRTRPARALVRGQYLTQPLAAPAPGGATRTVDLPTGTLSLRVDAERWPLDLLCGFAARRNPKRGFLVVSKVLGRHWPAAPATMRAAVRDLARQVPADLPGPVVVVGLAETAVCLGQTLHAELGRDDATFLHSTRQVVDHPLLGRFEEPHSHASAHLLYEPACQPPRTLVLVDDEVSTGTTLANIAGVLVARWPGVERIVIAGLADWSGGGWLARLPRPAMRVALLEGALDWTPAPHVAEDHAGFEAAAASLGRVGPHRNRGRLGTATAEIDLPMSRHPGLDPGSRFFPQPEDSGTPGQARGDEWIIPPIAPGTPLRIVGTGEFTYPPFRMAEEMAARGHDVVVQATSRSPARIGGEIRHALVFADNYGTGVPNYLYNADPADGRTTWVCHETPAVDPALLAALGATAIRWPA